MSKLIPIKGYKGILFIGDLHASSRRPGRRIDNYSLACLDKIRQSAIIANENNLYPVFLGDLFHRPGENNLEFLAQMIQVCRGFKEPLLVLGGSHDRTESWFTPKDAAYLLQDAGVVELLDSVGKAKSLEIEGRIVDIWAAPAESEIPQALDRGDFNILITHHDFDFNGPYPGSIELKEIENCDMLVNGHMHTPTPVVIHGNTVCHNPGSVTRVSIDLLKHKPAVSIWKPTSGVSLERVELEVSSDVFDLTGYEAFAAEPRDLKASLPKGLRLSSFAAKLRAGSDSLDAQRTDDGSVLIEEMESYFKLFDKPDNVKRYISGLIKEVVDEHT